MSILGDELELLNSSCFLNNHTNDKKTESRKLNNQKNFNSGYTYKVQYTMFSPLIC